MAVLRKRYKTTIILMLIIALILVACSKPTETTGDKTLEKGEENTSLTNPESILLTGIGSEDIEVRVDEIKQLKVVNRDVISISSSGEETEHNVTGGLLEELLGKHGVSQKELSAVRVTAVDGYSMEIPSEVLKNRDIILTYEMNGEPLFEESRPIRIVVPDERAMYWVRKLAKIEIMGGEAVAGEQVEKILIFDSAIADLKKHDYEYYENVDEAIKINDLLNKFIPESKGQVAIKAADGLERKETKETFKNAFIKISGKESPMFLAPDLSKGMYVKDLLWFSSDGVAFLTMDNALKTYNKPAQGNTEGVSLKEALDDIGLKEGNTYIFTASDGYSVEISKDDIDKGILSKITDGNMKVSFEGLQKNTTVKKLLSIEVK